MTHKNWTMVRSTVFSCLTTVIRGTLLSACAADSATGSLALRCDDSLKKSFEPDPNANVTLVKQFKPLCNYPKALTYVGGSVGSVGSYA